MSHPKKPPQWKLEKKNTQNATLLLSPASHQQKIKVLNMVIRPGIEYAFYATPFSIPDVREMDKLLIKYTKAIRSLTTSTLNIFNQLPQETFGTEACSLLPRYATTMSEHLTQTLNDPCPLGQN
jgi:hypothetical protein